MSQNRVLLAPLLEIIFTGYTNEIQRPRNPVAERGVDRCPNPTSLIPKAACLCIPLGLAVFTLPSPPKVTSGTRNCALPLLPLCSLPSRGRGRVCATGAARTVSAPSPGLRSQEPPLRESPQAKPQRGLPCDKRLRANASAVLPDAAPVGHPAQGAGPPSAGCLGRPGELPSLAGGTGASQPPRPCTPCTERRGRREGSPVSSRVPFSCSVAASPRAQTSAALCVWENSL